MKKFSITVEDVPNVYVLKYTGVNHLFRLFLKYFPKLKANYVVPMISGGYQKIHSLEDFIQAREQDENTMHFVPDPSMDHDDLVSLFEMVSDDWINPMNSAADGEVERIPLNLCSLSSYSSKNHNRLRSQSPRDRATRDPSPRSREDSPNGRRTPGVCCDNHIGARPQPPLPPPPPPQPVFMMVPIPPPPHHHQPYGGQHLRHFPPSPRRDHGGLSPSPPAHHEHPPCCGGHAPPPPPGLGALPNDYNYIYPFWYPLY